MRPHGSQGESSMCSFVRSFVRSRERTKNEKGDLRRDVEFESEELKVVHFVRSKGIQGHKRDQIAQRHAGREALPEPTG